jgi:transposase
VAASLLTAVYCILRDGTPYRDLGATYFDDRDRSHVLRRLTRRIEALGYHVAVCPAASVRGRAISS